jgi:phosphohistidine phosphatase
MRGGIVKTLLIMRHAKAKAQEIGQAERERELARRGKKDAQHMGELLQSEGLVPQRILSSTAVRALQTAEAVAHALGGEVEVTAVEGLYGGVVEDYLQALSGTPDCIDILLLIGHNPNMVELVATLTGTGTELPTGAIAQVRLAVERWKDVPATQQETLAAVWRPEA